MTSTRSGRTWRVRVRGRALWAISPPVLRSVGRAFFSLTLEQEETLPSPPFVIAANHYSHFDSAVIGAVFDMPIRFLALEDLFGANRILDWLVVGYGSIPTPRSRVPVSSVRTAMTALAAGEVVGVFPEATRVSHWGTLSPKRGAAWLAIRAGVPLIPVAVIGSGRAMDLDNRVHRAPIRVVVGRPMTQDDHDVDRLTARWGAWVGRQVERYPDSEVVGPRRAFHG